MPDFYGGYEAMDKFIKSKTNYPPIAVENGTQGTVVVSVVIEKDGSISNIKVISELKGDGLEEESLRVISMMPRWKPGSNNDIPVRVRVSIPIKFKLKP